MKEQGKKKKEDYMMADSSNGVLFGRDSQGTKTTPDHIGELKKNTSRESKL